jgi:hypothetical protein
MGLMGGLGDTLSFLGQRYLNDKDEKEKQAREDAKMAQQAGYQQQLEMLKEKAAQAHAEFEKSISPPSFQTYETTDDQGRTVKRTVKSTYDAAKHARNDEQVGEAPVPQPAPIMHNIINGDTEYTQAYDPLTGKTSVVGAPGKRWKGNEGVDEEAKARRAEDNQHALDRRQAMRSIDAEMKEFNRASNYDKEKAYQKMGIDPAAKDAAQQYRAAVTADKLDFYGLDPVTSKGSDSSGGLMGVKVGQKGGKPGSSQDNPLPATATSAEPPPGTWVKLPDGRVIQIPGG